MIVLDFPPTTRDPRQAQRVKRCNCILEAESEKTSWCRICRNRSRNSSSGIISSSDNSKSQKVRRDTMGLSQHFGLARPHYFQSTVSCSLAKSSLDMSRSVKNHNKNDKNQPRSLDEHFGLAKPKSRFTSSPPSIYTTRSLPCPKTINIPVRSDYSLADQKLSMTSSMYDSLQVDLVSCDEISKLANNVRKISEDLERRSVLFTSDVRREFSKGSTDGNLVLFSFPSLTRLKGRKENCMTSDVETPVTKSRLPQRRRKTFRNAFARAIRESTGTLSMNSRYHYHSSDSVSTTTTNSDVYEYEPAVPSTTSFEQQQQDHQHQFSPVHQKVERRRTISVTSTIAVSPDKQKNKIEKAFQARSEKSPFKEEYSKLSLLLNKSSINILCGGNDSTWKNKSKNRKQRQEHRASLPSCSESH